MIAVKRSLRNTVIANPDFVTISGGPNLYYRGSKNTTVLPRTIFWMERGTEENDVPLRIETFTFECIARDPDTNDRLGEALRAALHKKPFIIEGGEIAASGAFLDSDTEQYDEETAIHRKQLRFVLRYYKF